MPRIEYERWNPGAEALALANQATSVAARYAAQGYRMTVRQLYYQLVAAGLIPNSLPSYRILARVIDRARMSGLMDWNYIEDRTRNLRGNTHWSSPDEIIQASAAGYMLDHWAGQDVHVEVWVEKEALAGVVARVAGELDVDYFSCRGYTSTSEAWGAGRRLFDRIRNNQRVVILHLGDHDPSGIDMTRDLRDRLHLFTDVDWARRYPETVNWADPLEVKHDAVVDAMRASLGLDDELPLEIRRVALNYDQVEAYQPPPNPAKVSDPRAEEYIRRHGRSSWELDALPPNVLAQLIRDNVEPLRNNDALANVLTQEQEERFVLERAAARWTDVVDFLRDSEDDL